MNKNLFRANTIQQFKIGAWLATQGITREDNENAAPVSQSGVRRTAKTSELR